MSGLGLQSVVRLGTLIGTYFGTITSAQNWVTLTSVDFYDLESTVAGVKLPENRRFTNLYISNSGPAELWVLPAGYGVNLAVVFITKNQGIMIPPDGAPHEVALYPYGGDVGVLEVGFGVVPEPWVAGLVAPVGISLTSRFTAYAAFLRKPISGV